MKILINLDMRLGDEIMCLPAIQGLKERQPDDSITVRANHPDIFENNPFVDQAIKVEGSDEHRGFEEEEQYQEFERRFDRLIDLKWNMERGKNRIKFLCQLVGVEPSSFSPALHLTEKEKASFFVEDLNTEKPKVAVCSEAAWQSRQWPIKNFRKIYQFLKREKGAALFELGTTSFLGEGLNLVGRTTVREAARILSQCDLFLCNDSGLMHLALAVGTPTMAVFGPVHPETRVVMPNQLFQPLQADVDCLGCYTAPFGSRKLVMGPPDD